MRPWPELKRLQVPGLYLPDGGLRTLEGYGLFDHHSVWCPLVPFAHGPKVTESKK